MDKFDRDAFNKIVARIHVAQTRPGWSTWMILLDDSVVAICPTKDIANTMARGLMAWIYLEETHTPNVAEKLQKAIDGSIKE